MIIIVNQERCDSFDRHELVFLKSLKWPWLKVGEQTQGPAVKGLAETMVMIRFSAQTQTCLV